MICWHLMYIFLLAQTYQDHLIMFSKIRHLALFACLNIGRSEGQGNDNSKQDKIFIFITYKFLSIKVILSANQNTTISKQKSQSFRDLSSFEMKFCNDLENHFEAYSQDHPNREEYFMRGCSARFRYVWCQRYVVGVYVCCTTLTYILLSTTLSFSCHKNSHV